MKTPYEKISKYSLDHFLFGKAKRKYRSFYWLLFATYLILALLIEFLFNA
jgi:hypothetical protein